MSSENDMENSVENMQAQIAQCKEVLRRSGLKLTHQRLEIYRELAATVEHPDAETLYRRVRERMPTISLDTVYRTLRVLEEHGVIVRAGIVGDRGRFDANTNIHQHFVCTRCGCMKDVFSDQLNSVVPPAGVDQIGRVHKVHIELRGICRDCQDK